LYPGPPPVRHHRFLRQTISAPESDTLIIADEIAQDDQRQCRDDLRFYRQSGTNGYRRRRLTQIIDTLHFAPSRASRLVQAADMVAFLARRILCKEDNDPRAIAANERLWASVEPRVTHCWCWKP
jgi:hypothetical protein